MDNVIEFPQKGSTEELLEFIALCLACHARWVALCPARLNLFALECPKCRAVDSFASPIPPGFTDG
jgi:hypothetical protein